MSRDKQIDEMVKVMCGNREAYKTCKSCKLANVNAIAYCRIEHYAECLAKEGYRKASDVAREIFEEIEHLLDNYHSACHPIGAIEAYTYYEGGLGDAIADLKKKYESEGADDEN